MVYLTEPITMLTDYALAAAGLYFAASLIRAKTASNRTSVRLWSVGFASGAFAALVGGTYHGLSLQLSAPILRTLWNATLVAIGASAGFMISGFLTSTTPRKPHAVRWLKSGLAVTAAGLAIQQTGFHVAVFNHNDIYHCIQIVALYLFFRGVH